MTGPQLKALRHRLGLSCSEMADKLDLSGFNAIQTVRRWESGRKDIPLDVAQMAWSLSE